MSRIVHTSRSLALLAGLVMFGGVAVAPAMAATFTYNFSGEVDQVGRRLSQPTPPPAPFNTSSTMSGFIKVSDTPDGDLNPNRGSYQIQSFLLTVGGYTATFGPSTSNRVEIRNVSGGDRFDVGVNQLGLNTVRGLTPTLFEMNLRGGTSIFSNDHLPTSLPSISAFDDVTEWRLVFGTGGSTRTVSGEVSSITAVPLPAGVVLFGVGLVALIGLGAGGLRNLRLPQA